MTTGEADLLTSILGRVVTDGNGQACALVDRPAAGKTGTTDNYGDAWFVGYTPQLAVAVWVGYPDELKPMLTEFGGKPVAGGTLPGADLEVVHDARRQATQARARAVPGDAVHPGSGEAHRLAEGLVQARQRLLPGHACRRVLRRARARQHRRSATPNEVAVPLVIGKTVAAANATRSPSSLSAAS